MRAWVTRVVSGLEPVRFFVILAAVFGFAFLLITPPFQGADEVAHYLRAYQISEGHFVATKDAKGRVGGYLPSDVDKVINTTDNPSVQFYPQLKYGEGLTKKALGIPRSNSYNFDQFAPSASYPPTAYPLSSFGIFVTRILRLPTMVSLYAARLGNLLTWIVLVGLAIYWLPGRKWALVAVGLLPMALFQASTLNGDVITIGTLTLLLAAILKLRNDRTKLSTGWMSLLLVVTALMVLSKDIMFLFLPLVLLLRKENFSSPRQAWLLKTAVIVVPLLLFGAWMHASHGVSSDFYDNGQNPSDQLHMILHKPLHYVRVLWNTWFFTWGDGITRALVGTFGWADTPLAESIVTVGYIGLFLLLVGSYEGSYSELLSRRSKQLLLVLAVLYFLAVSTALYMYYSPVGFNIVYGLQGRYFLPLPLLAVPLFRTKLIKIDKVLYQRLAVGLPVLLLLCSTITIYVRYFVHNV